MSNLDSMEPTLDEGNEFSTVYGDLVTFIAVFFMRRLFGGTELFICAAFFTDE